MTRDDLFGFTAEEASDWVWVVGDMLMILTAAAIAIWQGIFATSPNTIACGLAATFFGYPMARRIDWRKRRAE